MGTRVFLDCASLVTVKLSENILSIPHSTFNRCYSLKNVDFSSRLARVEDYAFSECTSLVSMTLPNTITYIGNNAFLKSKKFNSITIKAIKPPLVASNSFNYTNLSSVFVPEVSIDAYKTFWSSIFDISKLKPITN